MPCPQTNDVECRICHQMMSWDEDYVHVPYELAPPIGGPAHAQCAERAQAEKERQRRRDADAQWRWREEQRKRNDEAEDFQRRMNEMYERSW